MIPDDLRNALARNAHECADLEAILAPGRSSLRFRDLYDCVEDIRATLNQMGVGRGDRVVTALRRGPEAAVCFFGVGACATCVPLNPDYSEPEFEGYLARLRPRAVIVDLRERSAIAAAATRLGIPILELAALDAAPAGKFELRGESAGPCAEPGWAGPEDIALILLTSGTTARPKLVPMKHRHLLAYARAAKSHFALDHRDRNLHTVPMFHGHGLKSSLTAPIVAGSGVICPASFDVASFFAAVAELRPTWYSASYTMQQAILDRIQDHRRVARNAKLRFISSGSGRIDARVVRGLEAAFDAPVIDRYSMSETGILACNPLPPAPRKPGSVGRAVHNELRIADERGGVMPLGREGEVLARGPSVFEGYLDDPELNAQAFVGGWFRTGDLGRLDEDGYLTLTGRIKDLINRGGEKIGTAEVERAIAEHPTVASVCVFGVPHPTLGEEVAAAVVPVAGALVDERSIIDFARIRLASFKVPRRIVFTTDLPPSTAGKIDRKALAQRYAASQLEATSEIDPTGREPSPIAHEVAQLWGGLLKTGKVETNVDFFLAGGDSLGLAELLLAIGRRFAVNLNLRDLRDEDMTVSGLARLIENARNAPDLRTALPTDVLAINAAGDRPALFAFPGADGHAGSFVHLGRRLDVRQPCYGLNARGIDGRANPLARIEDLAASHLQTIRQLQPSGPYFLVGACFGARVAYEVARQVEVSGEQVGLLVMLDPSPPFTDSSGRPRGTGGIGIAPPRWLRWPRFVLGRLRLYAHDFAKLDGRKRIAFVRAKLRVMSEVVARGRALRGDSSEIHTIAVLAANRAAGRRYVPGPYAGPVVLALTEGRTQSGPRNFRLDWLKLIPQCGTPRYVPGRDTGDMLIPPNVDSLATCLHEWLDDAYARLDASDREDHVAPSTIAAAGEPA